jgi:hypothetical protein
MLLSAGFKATHTVKETLMMAQDVSVSNSASILKVGFRNYHELHYFFCTGCHIEVNLENSRTYVFTPHDLKVQDSPNCPEVLKYGIRASSTISIPVH